MTARKKTRSRKPGRILAYLDLEAKNKPLLDLLTRLAKRDGVEVLALSVLRELPWYAGLGAAHSKKIRAALEHDTAIALEKEVAPLLKAGIKVQTRVVWGRPFEVIIREVLRKRTQLVMKTAHGDGRGQSRKFGSTAMHLFRKCPVPVLVVQPERLKRFRRVLAAVDPVEPTPGEIDLNLQILKWASKFATDEGAELHVCHAYELLAEPLLRQSLFPAGYRVYRREAMERIQTAMTDLISSFGLTLADERVHLRKGDPGRIIPALVKRQGTNLLVMGTIARAGIPGLLIGNTAERMLRSVDCSVLALKPKGFVSPVN